MVDLNDQYHQLLGLVARQFGGKDPAEQQAPQPAQPFSSSLGGGGAPPPDPYQSHLHEIAMANGGVDPAKQPAPAPQGPALQDPYTAPPPPNTGAPGAPYGAYRQEGKPWTQMQFDPQGQFTGISGYRRPDSPIPAAQPQAGPQPAAPRQGPAPPQYPVNGAGYGSGPAYGSGGASAPQSSAAGKAPIPPRPTTLDEARQHALTLLAGNPRALTLADQYAPGLMRQLDETKARQYQQQVEAAKVQTQMDEAASRQGRRADLSRHADDALKMLGQKTGNIELDKKISLAEKVLNEAQARIGDAWKIEDPGMKQRYIAFEEARRDRALADLSELRGKPAGPQAAAPQEQADKPPMEGAVKNAAGEWTISRGGKTYAIDKIE